MNNPEKEIIFCNSITEYEIKVNEIFKKHREGLRTFQEQESYFIEKKQC